MTLADAIVVAIHLVFAATWTGSVLLFTVAVLPLARDGNINAAPLAAITGSLRTVSRASAVLLLLTGGHMAGSLYTVDSLTGTSRGWLVIAMVVLWLALAALVEIGAGKLVDGTGQSKVRAPARTASRHFQAAAVVAVLLLLDAGALSGNLLAVL